MTGAGPLLRLTEVVVPGADTIEISYEEQGQPRRAMTVPLQFELSPQDRESLRWYYEDYLQFPAEPAPQIAARVQRRMSELGQELFNAVFGSGDSRDLWAQVRNRLRDTRVEVVADVSATSVVPWELLWDPKTDVPVAIRASAFVRGYYNPAQRPILPAAEPEVVRILLAICRPGGADDVPFRSVASRLVKSLGIRYSDEFRLQVLRPPTFAKLAETLRIAAEQDNPFHIVHFDGHGTFASGNGRPSGRGYVLFESPSSASGRQLVDGSQLGGLLVETGVPLLVLNACRSARRDPAEAPVEDATDPHELVRAYGSLAAEVMDAGVAGVVAMEYNVYVVTATQFIGDLYAALARGQSLSQSVSLGRKQLHAEPKRDLVGAELELRDWPVPVVYEAAPFALFKPSSKDEIGRIAVDASANTSVPTGGTVDVILPTPPDVGFFGRDETLLALDRAFDAEKTVLLHGLAGSGKTTTASEFGRWYALTGGIEGPVIFTSFEHYMPLPRVLDSFNRVFGPALPSQLNWLAKSDSDRRTIAINVLSHIPVLWIWDNVEEVSGVGNTGSPMTAAEQAELLAFLRELRGTGGRVLLTSRSQEHTWLGDVPYRVALPPMPMLERLQLARALALHRGRPIVSLAGWRSLLTFTGGNPLTVTLVVGDALRQNLSSQESIDVFVENLRAGAASVTDNPAEGRAKSLVASLSYGFTGAFDDSEQRILALLHLFQGTVTTLLLGMMGKIGDESVPELVGRPESNLLTLLDRAVDIGDLTARGSGQYSIHPALPSYFAELFRKTYPDEMGVRAKRAFCVALGQLSRFASDTYQKTGSAALSLIIDLEDNLLFARRIGRENGWHDVVVDSMTGLSVIYQHQGRWVEWGRLLDEVLPDYVNPIDDQPLAGHEDVWPRVTEFRVRISFERNAIKDGLRLQKLLVDRNLREAADATKKAKDAMTPADVDAIESASIALTELGLAQVECRDVAGIATLEQSMELARSVDSDTAEALAAYNLAVALFILRDDQELDRAETLLLRCLELTPPTNPLNRSRLFAELGFVHRSRSVQAAAQRDEGRWRQEIVASINAYETALSLTPQDAEQSLATKHLNLGSLYDEASIPKTALEHLQKSIYYSERASDSWTAGLARYRTAIVYEDSGRFADATYFAERALSDLEPLGQKAAEQTAELRVRIARLKGR